VHTTNPSLMLSWRSCLTAAVALAATTAMGCENPLAPTDIAGTYVLDAPIQTVTSGDIQVRLLADTLVITSDRTASRRISVEQVRLSTNDTIRFVESEMYTYRIKDAAIGLLTTCGINALCEDLDGPSWYDVVAGRTQLRPRGQPWAFYVRISEQ
jgi:hypothetical protein